MNQNPSTRLRSQRAPIVFAAILACVVSAPARAGFEEDLARVDKALKTNPSRVMAHALESCSTRRRFAVQLYQSGQEARATRSLRRCFGLLGIPEKAPKKKVAAAPTQDALQAKAKAEYDRALALEPDLSRGLTIYRECAACHTPEGWGMVSGMVPQIAGQHRNVIVKQLADIRAGNRDNVLMAPYSSIESIGGPQAVADVAAYIDTLEIDVSNGKGPGDELELGARVYREHCARCHGENGEGKNDTFVPRIQAQHYKYLLHQFESIRDGKRRNANPEMMAQIKEFEERETKAVLDYVSRLEPPEAFQAPKGWKNPDFQQ